MITIAPLRDSDERAALAAAGLTFACGAADQVFIAKDGQSILGFCQCRLMDKQLNVERLSPGVEDLPLCDGLLRAALFWAARRGATTAVCGARAPVEAFFKLGFLQSGQAGPLAMEKLFASCKSCEKDG